MTESNITTADVDESLVENIDDIIEETVEETTESKCSTNPDYDLDSEIVEDTDEDKIFAAIPTKLSVDEEAELSELNSFQNKNSEDTVVIAKKEKITLLHRAIQLKQFVIDHIDEDFTNDAIKKLAVALYKKITK